MIKHGRHFISRLCSYGPINGWWVHTIKMICYLFICDCLCMWLWLRHVLWLHLAVLHPLCSSAHAYKLWMVRSARWNSCLLWAQQLHMRLQHSVNLSRPTCAAYQSRLLWSARLTSHVLHCLALVSVFCLRLWFCFWLGAEWFIYTESFFPQFPLRKFGMSLQ